MTKAPEQDLPFFFAGDNIFLVRLCEPSLHVDEQLDQADHCDMWQSNSGLGGSQLSRLHGLVAFKLSLHSVPPFLGGVVTFLILEV
jgi:hypothetical protein